MGRYKELFQLLESKYGRDKTTYKMGDSITEGGAGWSGRENLSYWLFSLFDRSKIASMEANATSRLALNAMR